MTIYEISAEASKKLNNPINPEEWNLGRDGILVEGPTVDRKQIYIAEDLSINWRSIEHHNE
ncbi:MAG: hypothetical protein EA353_01070 [Puniceicoccaceae bacterium]|nr:MAG: hypothetical protein EA353_01070 [Puniceicoccaceae bacterium]